MYTRIGKRRERETRLLHTHGFYSNRELEKALLAQLGVILCVRACACLCVCACVLVLACVRQKCAAE